MTYIDRSALVLFSGGQDSTTCLAWALSRYQHVETVGFHYGQRHTIELECRGRILNRVREEFPDWGVRLGADHVLTLETLGAISATALTQDMEISLKGSGLPSTFVPGRNLVFFTFAAALSYRRGIRALVGGMCQTDYSGYPDCRNDALRALQVALNLGLASDISIETPLMWIDKAQTWAMAEDLGGKCSSVSSVRKHTPATRVFAKCDTSGATDAVTAQHANFGEVAITSTAGG
jgi:7-cyano-7-deazaguanine synthase